MATAPAPPTTTTRSPSAWPACSPSATPAAFPTTAHRTRPPPGRAARCRTCATPTIPSATSPTSQDDAQQTIYFRNTRVEPSTDYTYDAIYRLIEATGREHLGQAGGVPNPPDARRRLAHRPAAARRRQAMGRYSSATPTTRSATSCRCGTMAAIRGNPAGRAPTHYDEPSLLEPGTTSNRLSRTQLGAGPSSSPIPTTRTAT